jgi:hypothetical protein
MLRSWIALVALAAAVGVAGCETTPSPADQMHDSVSTFLQSCAEQPSRVALEELVPPAQDDFIAAGGGPRGCGVILRLPAEAATALTTDDFRRASAHVTSFTGSSGSVDVAVAGRTQRVDLTYGRPGWRIEGPGG